MNTLTIKLIFDEEWEDYNNVGSELLLEDSGIQDHLKRGIHIEIIKRNDKDYITFDKNINLNEKY